MGDGTNTIGFYHIAGRTDGHRHGAGGWPADVGRMLSMVIGVVADLWQYPVKSLLGEQRERVWLDQRGVIGDRLYAVRDEAGKFGSGKTTRRFRRIEGLFRFRAVYDGDVPLLTFPDGTTWRGDDPAIHAALSTDLRMPVK